LGFGTASDPLILFALWTGCGALVATALLLLAVLVIRMRLLRRLERERRCALLWSPLIAECAEGVPARLPPLARQDAETFLMLWCRAQESLRGEAQDHLREMARRLHAGERAAELLRSNDLENRLLGLIVFGHLRARALVPQLRALIPDAPPVVSLPAVKALIRIDPGAGVRVLLEQTARRADWPMASVGSIVRESEPRHMGPLLAAAIRAELARGGDGLARLLRLHAAAQAETLRPAVLDVLARSAAPEALAAALAALWHPEDTRHARRLLGHPQWFVRVAAARALARLGGAEDIERLTAALSDPSWWVRYRSAQALCAMPGMGPAELGALAGRLTDRFAADMLRQAMAERKPA
jgi:HEAT repeat protein